MDMVDVEPLNPVGPLVSGDGFITVSRQAYEAMEEELKLYRARYGALPQDTIQAESVTAGSAPADEPETQPNEVLSILDQDEDALKADILDDLEEGILSLSAHESIRHYGFKRIKTNPR